MPANNKALANASPNGLGLPEIDPALMNIASLIPAANLDVSAPSILVLAEVGDRTLVYRTGVDWYGGNRLGWLPTALVRAEIDATRSKSPAVSAGANAKKTKTSNTPSAK